MVRGGRAARWLYVIAATLFVALAAPLFAAGAQTGDGPDLVVRSIDGRDPDAVQVEFLWSGDRDQVPDLVVRENGEVVDHELPARLDESEAFGIVLAIDTSESMRENAAFERAKEAAKAFIANKADTDQIAIVGFGDVVQVMTDFTDDTEALNDAVDRLGLLGQTALYDAVQRSANLFDGTDLNRNVIVLTDGSDTSSKASEAAVTGLLDESGTLLYAIALDTDELNTDALERLTSSTGGSVLTSDDPGDLADLYTDAQDRLRQQFATTFVSQAEREGPSQLTLTIGATSGEASYTPGARLDSVGLVEPVPVPQNGGVGFLQNGLFLWVAVALVLVAVGGAAYAIGTSVVSDRPRLDRVLQPYSDGFVAPDEDEDRLATSAVLQRAVELTGDFAERRGILKRVEDALEQANLPLRAAEALFFYLVAVVIVTLLGGLLLGGVVGGVVTLIVAALIPPAILAYLANRRYRQFQEQLPDLLGLLASTMRAGYSFMQGVEATAQEVAEPARRELQRVVTEARLGMEPEEALEKAAERMRSRDFAWAAMAISIQRKVGGNLAELLDIVADTMRARDRLRRDIKSLTAEGRISAIVLGVLPIGLGLVIFSLNREYMQDFLDEPIGVISIIASVLLMLGGFFWMYKIVDIEV